MFSSIILGALLVAANVLGSAMAFPQARQLLRTRNVAGISGTWAALSTMMNMWWLIYGVANELWGLIPVSAIAVVLYSTILVVWTRHQRDWATALKPLGVGVGIGLIPLPFLVVGGWVGAGLAIGLGYGAQLMPALLASYRSTDLSGIAANTWLLAFGEAAIWTVYGVWVADLALLLGGVGGIAIAGGVLARLWTTGYDPFAALRPAVRYA